MPSSKTAVHHRHANEPAEGLGETLVVPAGPRLHCLRQIRAFGPEIRTSDQHMAEARSGQRIDEEWKRYFSLREEECVTELEVMASTKAMTRMRQAIGHSHSGLWGQATSTAGMVRAMARPAAAKMSTTRRLVGLS